MLNREDILECIKEPMANYTHAAQNTIADWKPLDDASDKILAGKPVNDAAVPCLKNLKSPFSSMRDSVFPTVGMVPSIRLGRSLIS